jgi:hypothetical protein
MYLHEVKIGDLVTFKQKGGKSLKGKVIHRHDGKDRPHLANYVNIQPEDKSAYPKTIHVSQIKPFITEDVSMEHISKNIDELVNSIQTDSSVDAIDAFNMAMQEKINAVLEVAKETVASSMFNTEECEDCNEELEGLSEEPKYNKDAVDKAIKSSRKKIGGKEAKAIHGLLRGWRDDYESPKTTIKKEEVEGLDEKLSGKQYKLDANHNGKLESDDFKMLRHEKESAQGEKKIAKYRKMTSEEVKGLEEGNAENKDKKNAVIAARGIKVVNDDSALMAAIERACAGQPETAQKVRDGHLPAAGALIGMVMKDTKGQADAAKVRALLLAHLGQSEG